MANFRRAVDNRPFVQSEAVKRCRPLGDPLQIADGPAQEFEPMLGKRFRRQDQAAVAFLKCTAPIEFGTRSSFEKNVDTGRPTEKLRWTERVVFKEEIVNRMLDAGGTTLDAIVRKRGESLAMQRLSVTPFATGKSR